MRKRFHGLYIILLLVPALAQSVPAAKNETVTLVVGGRPLSLQTPPVMIDENAYVPLAALDALSAKAIVEGKGKRDGQKIEVRPSTDGKFHCYAKLVGDELMLPIEEIASELGVVTSWSSDGKTLSILARVLGVEFDGSQVRVATSYPVTCDLSWWAASNKLILDLHGVHIPIKQSDLPIKETSGVPVRAAAQKDGQTGRIVFDMPCAVTYSQASVAKTSRIVVSVTGFKQARSPSPSATGDGPGTGTPATTPKSPGAAAQSLPASITDINYRKQGPRRLDVCVAASGPVKCVTSMSRQPDKLMVDMSRATLAKEFDDISVRHDILKGIRAVQLGEDRVRVTMDLTRVVSFDIRQDPKAGEVVFGLELPKGAGGLLAQKTVVIDPGHGGKFNHAQTADGVKEKDIALAVAKRLQRSLTDQGVCALLTRNDDEELDPAQGTDLLKRVDFAARHSADLFISIHCNGLNGKVSGTETYYHGTDRDGRTLAYCIHPEVVEALGIPDRAVRPDTALWGTGLSVLRNSSKRGIPAILVELGFIDHPRDAARICDPDYQQMIAEGIVRGLKAYVEGNPTPVRKTEDVETDLSPDAGRPEDSKQMVDAPADLRPAAGGEGAGSAAGSARPGGVSARQAVDGPAQ